MLLSSRAMLATFWALCTTNVLAFPLAARQAAVSDVDVLQFALTLEHLENTFYKQALTQFSQADFLAAGFNAAFFSNLQFVAHDEEQHVVFLQQNIAAAGASPVAACQYSFSITDVSSFVKLATVVEGVGVSAYLGAASFISSKQILNAAAAITVAEGLHQAVQRASILDVVSANIAGTPLSPNVIFTVASSFIKSCPSTNAALPFKAFSSLAVSGATSPATPMAVGTVATFTIGGTTPPALPASVFVTFVSGLDVVSVQGQVANGAVIAAVPAKASGQTFALLTNVAVNGTGVGVDDKTVLAGPAIMEVTPAAPTIDLAFFKG